MALVQTPGWLIAIQTTTGQKFTLLGHTPGPIAAIQLAGQFLQAQGVDVSQLSTVTISPVTVLEG